MPKVSNVPEGLRAFVFHGMQLEPAGGDQHRGECPWCGKGKMYVNVRSGLWDCKVCLANGNPLEFIRKLWEESDKATTDYADLAADRGLLYPETLAFWGVARSILTGEWLVPGYSPDGRVVQVYRYTGHGRRFLIPTAGFGHGLHGVNLFDPSRPAVDIMEGLWDGMIWWETLRYAKEGPGGTLALTGNEDASLLGRCNVVAAPGVGAWNEAWANVTSSRASCFFYDNDYPHVNEATGTTAPPAGMEGIKRAVRSIAARTDVPAPKSLSYLRWGKDGYDPNLPDKYDVRDALKAATTPEARLVIVQELMNRTAATPPDWVPEAGKGGSAEVAPIHCGDYRTLQNAWRRAFKWTDGLDRALTVMLAAVVSTETIGEPVWVKVTGPPSCGKTTLCEALSVARRYVYPTSTLTGFHSGYKSDAKGDEDHSIIPKLMGKTLVLKDGDTLLKAPNKAQILSEARDLYDGTSRAHYRHGMNRRYEHVRFTWILCGTSALRELDSSELGARFVDCIIMDGMDAEFERDVNRKVVYKALRNVKVIGNGEVETRTDPDMLRVKQLTGGFVVYLRENAAQLLSKVEVTDEQAESIINLGEFVAVMRARPSKTQEEIIEREFSSRLVEQYARLATCLAAVMGTPTIEGDVMRRLTHVALDTARGRTLDIVRQLRNAGTSGLESGTVALLTHQPEEKERALLQYLRKLNAVERYTPEPTPGYPKPKARWRLTTRVMDIYDQVMSGLA